MSQEAYVEFYETYLPSAAGAAVVAKLKAVKDEEEYCAIVLEAGRVAGYKFTADDARTVMKNSEAKRKQAQAAGRGELSKEQLDKAVGGATANPSQPVVNLGAPLNVSSLPPRGPDGTYYTVMCPW